MLDSLKRELKELVGQHRPEEVFRRLKEEVLDHESTLYNDMIQVQGRWNATRRQDSSGIISLDDKNRTFNSVSQALLWLIDSITLDDLSGVLRNRQAEHVTIAPRHAYSCNRVEQNDSFQIQIYDPPAAEDDPYCGKVHFFYLYGDARQAHDGLFKRLGWDLGGFLEHYESGDYEPGVRLSFASCKPRPSRNSKLFKINVLKALVAEFFEPINRQQPLQKRRLKDLCASPKLANFGPDDYVFVLLTMDDHNWDKQITPQLVRSLYEEFCNCELDEDSPQFFFFFGISYQKGNETVKSEVAEAMDAAKYGLPLDELRPISEDDLAEWLSRYRHLIPPGKTASEYAPTLRARLQSLDMIEVIPLLKQLIDDHNLGLL